MNLSIQQTADILGKTRRQVVYMITQGRLPAHKLGGRWVVQRADLQIDSDLHQRSNQKKQFLRAAVEEALAPGKQRAYSVCDLKAVQVALSVYRDLSRDGSGRDKAADQLRGCLDQLAIGCHRYHRNEKFQAYSSARDAASLAVMELVLSSEIDTLDPLISIIENELMPALAGLLRRSDNKGKGG